jgi:nitrite reductase (NADH) small subunit
MTVDPAMPDWTPVCTIDDIPMLGARRVRRPVGPDVALFRVAGDRVFALLDRCPHKGGPLSQGIVFGDRVACPLHNWSIGLADGEAAAPDEGRTPPFAVRVVGREVQLDRDQLTAPTPEAPGGAACGGACRSSATAARESASA